MYRISSNKRQATNKFHPLISATPQNAVLIRNHNLTVTKLTIPVPIPEDERKLTQIFIFTLLCGASKDFMKALKVFQKPFEAPHRCVKIKI